MHVPDGEVQKLGFSGYCQVARVRRCSLKWVTANTRLYRVFRFPREIISHVVWLYFRFSLNFRDMEELMAS